LSRWLGSTSASPIFVDQVAASWVRVGGATPATCPSEASEPENAARAARAYEEPHEDDDRNAGERGPGKQCAPRDPDDGGSAIPAMLSPAAKAVNNLAARRAGNFALGRLWRSACDATRSTCPDYRRLSLRERVR
jgi:hypothetical protein